MVKQLSKTAVLGEYLPTSLKQLILLFDQVAIIGLDDMVDRLRAVENWDYAAATANDLEYLQGVGAIINAGSSSGDDIGQLLDYREEDTASITKDELQDFLALLITDDELVKKQEKLRRIVKKNLKRDMRNALLETMESATARFQFLARVYARKLQVIDGLEATPVLTGPLIIPGALQRGFKGQTAGLTEVVLEKIPFPNDATPWEKIFDFKNDPETRGYLNGLHMWMREFVRQDCSVAESRDKLEWLLFQQEQHLRAHRIAFHTGAFGAAFIASAEVLENLIKIRLGKVAEKVVRVVNSRAKLLSAELASPAKEINYIVRAKAAFKK
jgi:hypothetical protein